MNLIVWVESPDGYIPHSFQGITMEDVPRSIWSVCETWGWLKSDCLVQSLIFHDRLPDLGQKLGFVLSSYSGPTCLGELPSLPAKEELPNDTLGICISHLELDAKLNAEVLKMKKFSEFNEVLSNYGHYSWESVRKRLKDIHFKADDSEGLSELLVSWVIVTNSLDVFTHLLDQGAIKPNQILHNGRSLLQQLIHGMCYEMLVEVLLRGGDPYEKNICCVVGGVTTIFSALEYITFITNLDCPLELICSISRDPLQKRLLLRKFRIAFIKGGVSPELYNFFCPPVDDILDPGIERGLVEWSVRQKDGMIDPFRQILMVNTSLIFDLTAIIALYLVDDIRGLWRSKLHELVVDSMRNLPALQEVTETSSFDSVRDLSQVLPTQGVVPKITTSEQKDGKRVSVSSLFTVKTHLDSLLAGRAYTLAHYNQPLYEKLRQAQKDVDKKLAPYIPAVQEEKGVRMVVLPRPKNPDAGKSMLGKVFTLGGFQSKQEFKSKFQPDLLLGELLGLSPNWQEKISVSTGMFGAHTAQLDLGDVELGKTKELIKPLQASLSKLYPKDPKITLDVSRKGGRTHLLFKNVTSESLKPLADQPKEVAEIMQKICQEVAPTASASPK